MNEDLISIIVPVYNAQRYVHDTVCSILAQTYTNIEVICVDDGSTDDTFARLEAFARQDGRIRLIRFPANRGTLAARNAAIGEDAASVQSVTCAPFALATDSGGTKNGFSDWSATDACHSSPRICCAIALTPM